jgi:hypothetical protein
MDFRTYRCAWCARKTGPLEKCEMCPKYIKIIGRKNIQLLADDFCRICINRDNTELEIYCERNRYFQREPVPGEDFDCYKYCPE